LTQGGIINQRGIKVKVISTFFAFGNTDIPSLRLGGAANEGGSWLDTMAMTKAVIGTTFTSL